MTELHIATEERDLEEVIRLLQTDIDIYQKYENDYTALELAVQYNYEEIALEILKKMESIDDCDESLFPWACDNQMYDLIDKLIEKNIDTYSMDCEQNTGLSIACKNNDEELALKLLELDCNPNTIDYHGNTPLCYASDRNMTKVVKAIVKYGEDYDAFFCNIDSVFNNGRTPLIVACTKNNESLAVYLIEMDADLDIVDVFGKTALLYACDENNSYIRYNLLEYECDVNISGKDRDTALQFACSFQDESLVELLLDYGADPNQETNMGTSPLELAILHEQKDIIRLLLMNGAVYESKYDEMTDEIRDFIGSLKWTYKNHKEWPKQIRDMVVTCLILFRNNLPNELIDILLSKAISLI